MHSSKPTSRPSQILYDPNKLSLDGEDTWGSWKINHSITDRIFYHAMYLVTKLEWKWGVEWVASFHNTGDGRAITRQAIITLVFMQCRPESQEVRYIMYRAVSAYPFAKESTARSIYGKVIDYNSVLILGYEELTGIFQPDSAHVTPIQSPRTSREWSPEQYDSRYLTPQGSTSKRSSRSCFTSPYKLTPAQLRLQMSPLDAEQSSFSERSLGDTSFDSSFSHSFRQDTPARKNHRRVESQPFIPDATTIVQSEERYVEALIELIELIEGRTERNELQAIEKMRKIENQYEIGSLNAVIKKGGKEYTLLTIALANGMFDLAKELVELLPVEHLNEDSFDGFTPLMWAINTSAEVAHLIIDKILAESQSFLLKPTNSYGWTALMVCLFCMDDNEELKKVAMKLIKHQPVESLYQQEFMDEGSESLPTSAVILAIDHGRVDCLRELVLKINVANLPEDVYIKLIVYIYQNNLFTIGSKALRDLGANPIEQKNGYDPAELCVSLVYYIINGHVEDASEVIKDQLDLINLDHFKSEFVTWMYSVGQIDIGVLLFSRLGFAAHGTDKTEDCINTEVLVNYLTLMCAIHNDQVVDDELLNYLGAAHLNLQDILGKTPLEVAKEKGLDDLAKRIQSRIPKGHTRSSSSSEARSGQLKRKPAGKKGKRRKKETEREGTPRWRV